MILYCDEVFGVGEGGYVFTFTTNPRDPVKLDNQTFEAMQNADTMSEVLRHLAEYAECVEDALTRLQAQGPLE